MLLTCRGNNSRLDGMRNYRSRHWGRIIERWCCNPNTDDKSKFDVTVFLWCFPRKWEVYRCWNNIFEAVNITRMINILLSYVWMYTKRLHLMHTAEERNDKYSLGLCSTNGYFLLSLPQLRCKYPSFIRKNIIISLVI